ncbi:MAG: hypothetical protein M1814_000114 [Vezdaea aestivalis]|nr:MAG: hypothetical protein M1814_000114 [Vezdaea aestivalis]
MSTAWARRVRPKPTSINAGTSRRTAPSRRGATSGFMRGSITTADIVTGLYSAFFATIAAADAKVKRSRRAKLNADLSAVEASIRYHESLEQDREARYDDVLNQKRCSKPQSRGMGPIQTIFDLSTSDRNSRFRALDRASSTHAMRRRHTTHNALGAERSGRNAMVEHRDLPGRTLHTCTAQSEHQTLEPSAKASFEWCSIQRYKPQKGSGSIISKEYSGSWPSGGARKPTFNLPASIPVHMPIVIKKIIQNRPSAYHPNQPEAKDLTALWDVMIPSQYTASGSAPQSFLEKGLSTGLTETQPSSPHCETRMDHKNEQSGRLEMFPQGCKRSELVPELHQFICRLAFELEAQGQNFRPSEWQSARLMEWDASPKLSRRIKQEWVKSSRSWFAITSKQIFPSTHSENSIDFTSLALSEKPFSAAVQYICHRLAQNNDYPDARLYLLLTSFFLYHSKMAFVQIALEGLLRLQLPVNSALIALVSDLYQQQGNGSSNLNLGLTFGGSKRVYSHPDLRPVQSGALEVAFLPHMMDEHGLLSEGLSIHMYDSMSKVVGSAFAASHYLGVLDKMAGWGVPTIEAVLQHKKFDLNPRDAKSQMQAILGKKAGRIPPAIFGCFLDHAMKSRDKNLGAWVLAQMHGPEVYLDSAAFYMVIRYWQMLPGSGRYPFWIFEHRNCANNCLDKFSHLWCANARPSAVQLMDASAHSFNNLVCMLHAIFRYRMVYDGSNSGPRIINFSGLSYIFGEAAWREKSIRVADKNKHIPADVSLRCLAGSAADYLESRTYFDIHPCDEEYHASHSSKKRPLLKRKSQKHAPTT